MTKLNDTNNNITYVAIDVAKQTHEVLIRFKNGKIKALKIPNNRSGFDQIVQLTLPTENTVIAAIEPTADYHRLIAYWLNDAGLSIHLASSLACARAREMLFKTWDKNDRKDARVILYLLQNAMTTPFHDPLLAGHFDTQELSNTYYQISQARTRCYHSIVNHYLTLYFPESEKYLHNSRSQWWCRLMIQHPTPGSITRQSKQRFIQGAWDIVGRKVAKQQFLEHWYDMASQSIGLPVNTEGLAVKSFVVQLQRYLELTEQRQVLEKQADNVLQDEPDYHYLRSLPGVGPIIAMIILAESGHLNRFAHYRQYLAYCEFNLSSIQSGRYQGQPQLSKRGNARLRYAWWLAANSAIRQKENSFSHKFRRYISKDPNNANLKRKGYTATAIKMARVAHALIKQQRNYQPYYEFG